MGPTLSRRALTGGALAGGALAGLARAAADLRPPSPIAAITAALAAQPIGPALLESYPSAAAPPALRGTAFVYDNALALIALLAVGEIAAAARIGEALLLARGHDRFWHDGRLRNAYRAGGITAPVALPGFWDRTAKLWREDAYQVGTDSGPMAWAALALFHLARHGSQFEEGARGLTAWLSTRAWSDGGGVVGGFFGEEPAPTPLSWQSTEQNIDAAVVLALAGDDRRAALCRSYVAGHFDRVRGCFLSGSGAGPTALDANLWPLLAFPDAPPEWRRALGWVKAHHQAEGGLGYRQGPDGLWTEGTAFGAITFAREGDAVMAARLRAVLPRMVSASGYLFAANHEIRTGLAISPDSTTDDFRYFRLPHLGATAWAALGQRDFNPFLIPRDWF